MPWSAVGQFVRRTVRGGLYVGYYLLAGRTMVLRSVDQLDRLHYAPRAEIDAEVDRHLRALLYHASQTVPYYRDLIDGSILSRAPATEVLQSLPILTKETIRREAARLVSERPGKKVRWNTSGGSTGEPVRLLQDEPMNRLKTSGKLLFMCWAGYKTGEPHVLIWGVPRETLGERISLHERVYRVAHNQTFLNCYGIDDKTLGNWISRINAVRPAVIEAYADALYELSLKIVTERLRIASPRGIITSAGVLTPERREVIGKAFGCPVLNRYGSREVSDMACSCLSSPALHVNESLCYLEIVDEQDQPCPIGVEGDILVTLFTNYTMPLVRYRIEDRGMWASGHCGCGRKSKRLASVCGRQNDYLLASDGTKINGTALTTLLYSVSGIRRYQYRQISTGKVALFVVPLQGVSEETLKRDLIQPIRSLRTMLKGAVVDLCLVNDIPPSRSGKFRYIVRDVVS